MFALNDCTAWFETLFLILWYFLRSPEGTQVVASLSSILLILYYLRKGAMPGGKIIATILTAMFAIGLWSTVLSTVNSTSFWEMAGGHKCVEVNYSWRPLPKENSRIVVR